MSENDDLIVSEVNFGLAEIPSNNQKEEYIVSTFRYSTSEQTEPKKPVKLIYDEDGDLIRDDLEEELEIQIKHKIQSDLGSIFL